MEVEEEQTQEGPSFEDFLKEVENMSLEEKQNLPTLFEENQQFWEGISYENRQKIEQYLRELKDNPSAIDVDDDEEPIETGPFEYTGGLRKSKRKSRKSKRKSRKSKRKSRKSKRKSKRSYI